MAITTRHKLNSYGMWPFPPSFTSRCCFKAVAHCTFFTNTPLLHDICGVFFYFLNKATETASHPCFRTCRLPLRLGATLLAPAGFQQQELLQKGSKPFSGSHTVHTLANFTSTLLSPITAIIKLWWHFLKSIYKISYIPGFKMRYFSSGSHMVDRAHYLQWASFTEYTI